MLKSWKKNRRKNELYEEIKCDVSVFLTKYLHVSSFEAQMVNDLAGKNVIEFICSVSHSVRHVNVFE